MKELFGAPTSTIAIVLVALLGVAIATVAVIAIKNRTWFRMGVRNLPRRGVQTVLVVAGLMLGTLITTAAFVTGDTIDHSLTKTSYDLLQRSDLEIAWNGERDFGRDVGAASAGEQAYVDGSVVEALEQQFANDPDIAGFLPALYGQAAVSNVRTGVASPVIEVAGYDAARLGRLGGLRLTGGGQADLDLPAGSAYLNQRAAEDLKARTGDTLSVTVAGQSHAFKIAGIVENELASGELGLGYASVPGGLALPLEQVR
ncbi:MAG: ABC transporter permease, partial [Dehalococcoidia bacterium]